jgi:hypothetical protein
MFDYANQLPDIHIQKSEFTSSAALDRAIDRTKEILSFNGYIYTEIESKDKYTFTNIIRRNLHVLDE